MRSDFWDDLLCVRKRYAAALEPVCREYAMTQNAMDVLLFLFNNPEYDRAVDIVERRNIAKSHVSAAVQELAERGLLQRGYEPGDRRTVHLKITADGREIAWKGKAVQNTFFEKAFAGISEEECEQMKGLVTRISKNISNLEEK